ncbi:MAG: histidine--tRNA ligase [Candidatus Altiarchaeota archaeon]|nr:histidine--tRNA ligase [Candidatus Altiarchaeota archaeon]
MFQNPKGMRDFSPDEMILRNSVFRQIESVFVKYGFDPIETPVLEYWETLKGKYGQEADSHLLYHFKDRWGETELALRYDLTVPLARYMSSRRMPLPFKRHHIGRVWRHENPQRGRYREFWQCDADIVGSDKPEADAEIISLMSAVMDSFKFPDTVVKINDRRLLKGIFENGIGIAQNKILTVYREIDKLDKLGLKQVTQNLKQVLPVSQVNQIADILQLHGDLEDVLSGVEASFGELDGTSYLREMFDRLEKGVMARLDLSLVRGLDYYTGPIFEINIREPKLGSLGGGGRYDELIARYGGPDLPAVGSSIGVERLIDAGLAIGIFKLDQKTLTDIFIAAMDGAADYAISIAHKLRKSFNVQTDLMQRNLKKQLDYADKKGIEFVIIVGEKEKKAKTAVLVEKRTGKRHEIKLIGLEAFLKKLVK